MPADSRGEMHIQAETLLDRGEIQGARDLYVRICEIAPDDADAWLMLALIDGENGNHSDALAALRTAITHDPGLTEAHFNLAGLLAQSGKLVAAAESCEKAVQLEPDHKDAWLLLGTIRGRLGEFQRAASSSRRALSLDPASVEAAENLGMALSGCGQYQEALRVYTQIAQQHPSNTRVLLALATLFLETGKPDKAAATCRALLALEPANVDALSVSGTANQMMGNLREATDHLGRAVTLQPDSADNTYKLACACQALGELDHALSHFQRTLELEPESATAISGLVRVHDQRGDKAAVKQLLPDLLEAADRNLLVLPTLASIAPKFGLEDISLKKLLLALDRSGTPDILRARLHWAAGSLFERKGDVDAAFEHHRASKSSTRVHYDADAHSAFVDRIISTFTREFLESAPKPSNHSELPVFIVGMPRSGTSLVEQILASHAQVFGAGELDTLSRIVRTLPNQPGIQRRFPECCQDLTTVTLDRACIDYLDVICQLSGDATRITDKMPHNFLHLGLIQLLFPAARIIHVTRNPLDTCLSCYFQEFSNAHAYSCDLADLGAHYRDYQRLMKHWTRVLQVPILDLRYEELIEEPERMMHALADFCGLPWDPACAEFHRSDRIVATLSNDQVREPLNRKSIDKWKRYEKYLGRLKTALGPAAF